MSANGQEASYVPQDVLEQIAGDDSWSDNVCEMANGAESSVDFQSMAKELLAYRKAYPAGPGA